ncbi:hypothetical protein [Rhodococcus qingshengii]|uniref:hypothetical protein n=1 Tax=Rhodococcus qingshengii TaxID=334542 RepID=UPI00237D251F|nr:hypothetical protein [Rhodococcus qingshengii]WCT06094.1 hypothetical protein PI247_31335 [Rhodococcus qingshengii]
MDAPQWFALGAVGTGLVSLALQIAVLFVDRDGGGRLLIRAANSAAALALLLAAVVLFL